MKIMLLGSGGREHALAWKLTQSQQCETLYIAPGNAGTALCGTNVPIADNDVEAIKDFLVNNKIDMLVVGPEQPLVEGLADIIQTCEATKHVIVIGPNEKGAQLEGSKDFAKQFMRKYQIPTAQYATFTKQQYDDAVAFMQTLQAPYVLKADGLAAGKGVIISPNLQKAKEDLHAMFFDNKFGNATDKVLIEEFLAGIEMSVFVLTDGSSYVVLPSAKDYKRIGEGDTGLNTGGMGSVSPVPFADDYFMQKVEQRIIRPTIAGLQKENIDYCGFIFFGLMNVQGNPYVIEYNVRMGDPETESVMPRLKNDLVDLFVLCGQKRLHEAKVQIDERFVATIMLVSGGYPEKYEKGKEITGLENVKDSIIFHAGTKNADNNTIVTNGGRVLTITSYGKNIEEALAISNRNAQKVVFDKVYFRRDIGKDLMK